MDAHTRWFDRAAVTELAKGHLLGSGVTLGLVWLVVVLAGLAVAGAVSVSPGVQVCQIADGGLALELTAIGAKFYQNKDLN